MCLLNALTTEAVLFTSTVDCSMIARASKVPTTNAMSKVSDGVSVASGVGVRVSVKVGDSVLYGKYSGTELKLDSKNYLIMRESDILAIV